MTSKKTARPAEPTKERTIIRGKFGWDGRSGGLRRRDDARVRLLVLPQRHSLGISLEQVLVEILVRLQTLRHLPDRGFGLVELKHLLPDGREFLTQCRLIHFGAFQLVAQSRQDVADLASQAPLDPRNLGPRRDDLRMLLAIDRLQIGQACGELGVFGSKPLDHGGPNDRG